MPNYIDKDKMIQDIKDNYVIYGYEDFLNDFFKMVDEQPTVDAEQLVELINQLIEEAVEDGGDAGGAYNQNQKGLTKAINDLLEFFGLSNYEVVETNDRYSWSRIMVGKRIDTPTDPVQE